MTKSLATLIAALALPCGAARADTALASLLTPLPELVAAAEQASPAKAKAAPKDAPATQAPEADAPVVLGATDILPELTRLLQQQYAPQGTLKVALLQGWRGARVKNAAWRAELVRTPAPALAQRMVVPVRILCGDEAQGEFQIPVSCQLEATVWVPRRNLNRGDALSPDDFEAKACDLLDSPLPEVPATEALADYQLHASVAAGQPLLWRDVEQKPLVRRGQVVDLVASEGYLRITVKAEALENGRAGDFIAVRNLSSRKDLQAKIVDDQTVQVFF